jgi:hypothetical protein
VTTLLPGFIATAPPRSVTEAVARVSHDRLKTIAKSAVERYLRRFLDSSGDQHALIGAIAKGALSYITDKSIDATQDVTRRTTQLVRLFNEVRQHVPSIVIIDAGMESIPSGLMSGLTHAMLNDGKWQGWFNKQFRIPLSIAVLTQDQDSTDQLMEVIELTLNNLRQTAGGSALRSEKPDEHWEVRLPLTFGISGTAGENVTDDPKDQLWIATFDLTVDAEDTFAIELPMSVDLTRGFDRDVSQGGVTDESDLSSTLPPLIETDDTMRIGQQYGVVFRRLRLNHRIVIDQPTVATIDLDARLITPRRLGQFNLQVLDIGVRQTSERRAMAPTVAAQKAVTVTL